MEAFVELLEEEDWLTQETKTFAKEKVSMIVDADGRTKQFRCIQWARR